MDEAVKELLEAQLRYELARFKPRKLRQTIRAEVTALFGWLRSTTLRELITAEQVLGLIAGNVVERRLPDAVAELATVMSRSVLASSHNDANSVADICSRTSFDAVTSKIAGLHDARRELIHRMVSSSVYTQQISDVLFTGIKDYLLTENILAQRVPGLASLIKLGKYAVNKTMRPLEAAVEKAVRAYIEGNLGDTIRRSEQSINNYFDEARIAGMGHALWDEVAEIRLSEFMRFVDGEDMDEFVDIGLAFWEEFRTTPYFKAIYTELVHTFFNRYANTKLSALAAEFGVTAKIATDELTHALANGVDKALASGYLEMRVRANLEGFYRSPEATKLIASLATTVRTETSASPMRKAAPAKPAAAGKKAAADASTAETKASGKARNRRNLDQA